MATIETRQSHGKTVYRVRYRLPGGHQKVLTSATRAGAERFIAYGQAFGWQAAHDAAHATDGHPQQPPELTVTDQAAHHIDTLSGITGGTRATYTRYLTQWIEPHFGGLPLADLDRAAATAWVTWMADAGLSGKSIRNRHSLLSAAVQDAVITGTLHRNPLRGQRLPKTPHQEMCFLEPAEFAQLLDGAPEHYRLFLVTLVSTGLRFGEATALRVRDLNLTGSSLRVAQAWKGTGQGARRELGVPKTGASTRTVAVSATVMAQLIQHARGHRPDDLLFTNTAGGTIKQGTFYRNAWVPARAALAGDKTKRAKNPVTARWETVVLEHGPGKRPRVHDLRHTFASWAIQSGTPLPVIQRQLGHDSITTTVDTYGHLARSDFDAMAARIAGNLPGPGSHPRLDQ